jgi:1,4-alpha-glucan branching enzyme
MLELCCQASWQAGHVTFRIYAPQAQNVRLAAGDIPALAGGRGAAPTGEPPRGQMTKAENGVWEITLGPINPGAYRYNFNVDGVSPGCSDTLRVAGPACARRETIRNTV